VRFDRESFMLLPRDTLPHEPRHEKGNATGARQLFLAEIVICRRGIGLIGVLALIAGLGGGAAATYVWMTRLHAGSEDTGGACRERTASTEHKAGDHDEHEASTVKLSEDAKRQFGVEVAQAAGGRLERTLRCPAEIVLNADKAGHP